MDVFLFFVDDDDPSESEFVATASEYTGTEIGGGGGIDWDAKAAVLVENACWWTRRLSAFIGESRLIAMKMEMMVALVR